MPSLKDIKGRIASVKSTLKITSAMKMVSSAKLHGAQTAIENMLPYEVSLRRAMSLLPSIGHSLPVETVAQKVALVCFSSNSSLCGGFNSNVIRETRKRISELRSSGEEVEVFPVGRKIAEAMKKDGFDFESDGSEIVGKVLYESSASFAEKLCSKYYLGEFGRVELIYNHFVTTTSQRIVREIFLPFEAPLGGGEEDSEFILEPSSEELLERLLPKVVKLKIHTVVLDTVAAEHAARTVAMQTASDNADEILSSLNLEYNKKRQQKITSEILDIIGGSQT